MSVQYYVHDDDVGLQTDAVDERHFHRQCSLLLGQIVEHSDAEAIAVRVEKLLPYVVEICVAYRGYKTAGVLRKVAYVSGDIWPQMPPVAQVLNAHHEAAMADIQDLRNEEFQILEGKDKDA